MKTKNVLPIFSLLLLGSLLISILAACQPETPETSIHLPKLVITPEDMDPVEAEIAEAFKDAIAGREDVLSYLIYDVNIDNIETNGKKNRALIWLSLTDPATGDIVPAETGLALAQKQPDVKEGNPWKITLQSDADWLEVLNSMPDKLIDAETKDQFSNRQQSIPHAARVYKGYRLPWATGETKKLSGSIGHVYLYKSCPTTCMYAFDFYDGTMWDILAAKGGRVKYAVWQYPNGNTKHANYIVLEDTSTNPTTYQVYMHLAQDSIPEALRTPGARVVQGQKIGVVDDTGYSTGHHLHFHVHTSSSSYWGTSVDIVFDEVKVNGGRPRTCYEAKLFPSLGSECNKNDAYVSMNNDYEKPTGKISSPAENITVSSQTLEIKGRAKDDHGLQSLKVLLSTDGTNWITASDVPLSSLNKKGDFTTTIDLCALEVPDGNFMVALGVTDRANKDAAGQPGLRTLIKQFDCPLPPPKCTAAPDQIGLYEEADLQGECILLGSGDYEKAGEQISTLNSLGSIQVGSEAVAKLVLPDGARPVTADILNLDETGVKFADIQTISVQARPPLPQLQDITVTDEALAEGLYSNRPILVSWQNVDASFEYQASLLQGEKLITQTAWGQANSVVLKDLLPGVYTFQLESRNILGSATSKIDFTVQEPDLPPVTTLDDLSAASDSTAVTISWKIVEGLNDLQHVEVQYRENDGEWQLLGTYPAPITSTVFTGRPESTYEFRIRGVDVANNTEEFHGGNASRISIAPTCTPDEYDQTGEGDDAASFATQVQMQDSQRHNICDAGDVDFYQFTAEEGKVYRIIIRPSTSSGAYKVQLLGSDGSTVVSEIQSEKPGSAAMMNWSATGSGPFYITVSSLDPALSGDQTTYRFDINEMVQLTSPNILVPAALVPILLTFLAASRKFFRTMKK